MNVFIIVLIVAAVGFLIKIIWDAAEVHELHKMRAAFSSRALDVKEIFQELKPGLVEAENFVDAELEEKRILDNIEDFLGL